jgi:hypothetical protein
MTDVPSVVSSTVTVHLADSLLLMDIDVAHRVSQGETIIKAVDGTHRGASSGAVTARPAQMTAKHDNVNHIPKRRRAERSYGEDHQQPGHRH